MTRIYEDITMEGFIDFVNNLSGLEVGSIAIVLLLIFFISMDKIILKKNNYNPTHDFTDSLKDAEIISTNGVTKFAVEHKTLKDSLSSALSFYLLNDLDSALKSLNQSKELATDPKDLVKINIIIRKFNTNESLNLLLEQYFQDFFPQSSAQIVPPTNPVPETYNKDTKSQDFHEKDSSSTLENENNKELKDNSPIDLASQLKSASTQANLPQVHVPCHDVWANYMCMESGRMGLKNTFFHLENPWGSVASIAELQDKISKEIGLTQSGEPKEWVMVSVIPFQS